MLPPVPSPQLLRWFTWHSKRYIRRHFHSLRVSGDPPPPELKAAPWVVYSNHSSWWDPLVGLALKAEYFPERTLFAPIDAAMLRRYPMLGKFGFFGVDQRTGRGGAQFLRAAEAILRTAAPILAVTPQGRFADARERPVQFQPGLGHLAARAQRAVFLPMASEFVFWEERLPEILVRFGEPIVVGARRPVASPHRFWTGLLESQLAATQDALAVEAQRRRPADFRVVLQGAAGPGGVYDLWRWLKAKGRGETFNRKHGVL